MAIYQYRIGISSQLLLVCLIPSTNVMIYLYILALFIKIFGAITSVINYRLYYRLSKLISFFISDNILCKIKIFKDTNFTFYFNDPYYNRLIFKNYKYESEIENF